MTRHFSAGSALHLSHPAPRPWIHGCGGSDSGSWHRRQYRRLQRGEHSPAAPAALSATRSNLSGLLRRRPSAACPARPTPPMPTMSSARHSRSYQDVTGYFAFSAPDNLRLTRQRQPVPATGIDVIGNFFQVLGVQPAMGRLFTPEEARTWRCSSGSAYAMPLVAAAVCRRPEHRRQGIDMNGTPVDGDWRPAREL